MKSSPKSLFPFGLGDEELEGHLAPYAAKSAVYGVREKPEEKCPFRGAFQRDRDRLIHCRPFRRLAHKTQVFIATLGDHHRTRLTHTLEVSQIARALARCFRLNEDLTEAIALGHDLGHTPFGHAGERTLDRLSPKGFAHQRHSLRLVEKLAKGQGLNLTLGVKDGILRHSKGQGPIFAAGPESPLTLEGQLVRVADIIAYLAHDLADALRAELVAPQDIPPDISQVFGPRASTRIRAMVSDLCANSRATPQSLTLAFSKDMEEAMARLRVFLRRRVYSHPELNAELAKGEEVIKLIHHRLLTDDSLLGFLEMELADNDRYQAAADFIAGMTDRYALSFGEFLETGIWPGPLERKLPQAFKALDL